MVKFVADNRKSCSVKDLFCFSEQTEFYSTNKESNFTYTVVPPMVTLSKMLMAEILMIYSHSMIYARLELRIQYRRLGQQLENSTV